YASPAFLWAEEPRERAAKMNDLSGEERIDPDTLADIVHLRDLQVSSGLGKAPQVVATAAAREFWVDRRMRVSPPRPLTESNDGPLHAVRPHVLTRRTLGGIHPDASGRAR